MGDSDQEEEIKQLVIPKIKLLYEDIEIPKRIVQVEENIDDSPVHKEEEKKEETEAKQKPIDKILEFLAEILVNEKITDKEIAIQLKKRMDQDIDLMQPAVSLYEKEMEENGVWQVIIGRQFAASVTFDAKYMIYFQLEESGKYYLLFRS